MRNKSLFLVRALLVMVVAFVGSAVWAQTNRYTGNTWALVNAKQVLAAAAEITPAKYPDCDDATVEKKMVRVYRADGTGEAQDETFQKVLTEKGKRGNRTLDLSYMLPYFTVEVVKLEVIKPDGRVVPVDVAANSKDSIDSSQMSMNIYDPNNHVLEVSIPELEIGDMVHSVTRLTVHRSIIPGEFAEENLFEGSSYIRHMSYVVYAPEDKPLKSIRLRDEVAGTVHYTTEAGPDNTTVHRWEVSNVPRMFDEPAMPPYEVVLQRLLVSTTPSWQDVSKWYWQLSQSHLEATSPEMKQQVQKLTAAASTDMDKIKALFYYVSKNIRYMGVTPEKDRPGFEPHDVRLTFEKDYGVCRDKAALLVAMLRMAGLQAYPVLINVGTKKDPEVADPFFNHAIVSVQLKPGDYVLMDPTDEHTRELLPASECDQSYLVCRPEGENIRVSPIQPAERNMLRVTTTGVLSAAGTLEAKSVITFGGINDNSYRSAFARMKPDDQRRFFERNLKRTMPGARLKSLKLTPEDMLDVSHEVRAELEFSVEGMTACGHDNAIVSLPWIGKGMGVVNFILGGTGLEKRKYPMQTYVACGLSEQVSLQLGKDFTGVVSMPSCSPVNDPGLSYQQSYSFKGGQLDCSRELKLKVVEFSPKQYLQLKQTLKALEYDERKAPVMALAREPKTQMALAADPAGDGTVKSNARLLDSDKELDVTDAHTAVYRVKYSKRILTYSGKVREAEIKLDYNPSCQEAKLIRGVVLSKSGQRQEISKGEINVMDAGWNASAKRYTGGKILVANLPGVEIGSRIEVEFEIRSKGVPYLAGFESFQMPDELARKAFRLRAPAGVKVHTLQTGPAGIVTEDSNCSGNRQLFTWHAQNVKALPAESQLPPEWLYMAGVQFFVGDLKAYLQSLNETMVDRSGKSSRAAELARKLTRGAKDRPEAVKAIRDYIAKNIRLAGPSFTDLPLSELSAADTTLSDGYGHMADRAILYYAMLRAAGFEPQFVLASGLPPIKQIKKVAGSFPLPNAFSTPLVRVRLGGQYYYLNDTDQYARLGSTYYDGGMAIVLADQKPVVIRAAKDCHEQIDTQYTLSLSADGKTRLGVSRRYYGALYNSKNRYFSELPPEERRRYFQEVVSATSQGARPIGDLVTRFDTYPGLEQYTVEIDHYAVVDGKYLYFDLPFTPSLFAAGADHRTLPLFLSGEETSTIRTELHWPKDYGKLLIAPASGTLKPPGGGGLARISSKGGAGRRVFTHVFKSSPAIVSPKDYPGMLQVQSALARKSSRVLLLEKGS